MIKTSPRCLVHLRYLYKYQEQMPVEQVVRSVCNYKQAYTQFGGLRPFGTAFLFAGDTIHVLSKQSVSCKSSPLMMMMPPLPPCLTAPHRV